MAHYTLQVTQKR